MTEQDLRLECLKIASDIPDGEPASVEKMIREAQKFFKFVNSGSSDKAELVKLVRKK